MSLINKVDQFNADADIAHQIVHGDKNTIVATQGGPVRSFAKLIDDKDKEFIGGEVVQQTIAARDTATQKAAEAAVARDAAFVNADVYADTTAGLASTTDNQQFQIVSGDEIIRYKNNAGSAIEVARYPSKNFISSYVNEHALDLFKTNGVFNYSNIMPVRRYRDTGPNDYTDGTYQTLVDGGVKLSVPASGTNAIKHYFTTAITPQVFTAEFKVSHVQTSMGDAVGVGFKTADNFEMIALSNSGSLARINNYSAVTLQSGLGTHGLDDIVKFIYDGTNITVYVNGVQRGTPVAISAGDFIVVGQVGFSHYISNIVGAAIDPIRDYVTQEIAESKLDMVTEPYLQTRANDLFYVSDIEKFPEANLPVRRYTAIDTFNDYPASYSQTATEEGLKVSVPAAGSTSIKHYLSTGLFKSVGKQLTANFTTNAAGSGFGVGLGYKAGDFDWIFYYLSESGVFRKVINYTPTTLATGLQTYSSGAKIEYRLNETTLTCLLNDALVYTHALAEGEFEGEIVVGQAGFSDYTFIFTETADPIRDYVSKEISELSVQPIGFYEYLPTGSVTGNGRFRTYVHISGNTYVGFNIDHVVDMRDLVYVDYWRLVDAYFYQYINGEMLSTGLFALSGGESECVWKRNSNKDDFTGGYHGDEILTSVLFFADGVQVSTDLPIPLTQCNEFSYLEHSTMHATAEGGVFIAGHPIECYHVKRTSFKDGGYETFNRLTWEAPGLVTLWYHGISCVGKPAAATAYTEATFMSEVFTGSGVEKLNSVGHREMHSWGSDYSAYVTSTQILPASADATSTLFISDRNSDSKYYRRSAPATVSQGDVWESLMTVRFGGNTQA